MTFSIHIYLSIYPTIHQSMDLPIHFLNYVTKSSLMSSKWKCLSHKTLDISACFKYFFNFIREKVLFFKWLGLTLYHSHVKTQANYSSQIFLPQPVTLHAPNSLCASAVRSAYIGHQGELPGHWSSAFEVHVNKGRITPTPGPCCLGLPEGLPHTLKYSGQLRNRWPVPSLNSSLFPKALFRVRYGVLQTMDYSSSNWP